MIRVASLLLLSAPVLSACSADANPYDRSKWDKAEQPIRETTNNAVSEGFAEAEQSDSDWAGEDNGGWGEDTEFAEEGQD